MKSVVKKRVAKRLRATGSPDIGLHWRSQKFAQIQLRRGNLDLCLGRLGPLRDFDWPIMIIKPDRSVVARSEVRRDIDLSNGKCCG